MLIKDKNVMLPHIRKSKTIRVKKTGIKSGYLGLYKGVLKVTVNQKILSSGNGLTFLDNKQFSSVNCGTCKFQKTCHSQDPLYDPRNERLAGSFKSQCKKCNPDFPHWPCPYTTLCELFEGSNCKKCLCIFDCGKIRWIFIDAGVWIILTGLAIYMFTCASPYNTPVEIIQYWNF
jgi:hypothetical protein